MVTVAIYDCDSSYVFVMCCFRCNLEFVENETHDAISIYIYIYTILEIHKTLFSLQHIYATSNCMDVIVWSFPNILTSREMILDPLSIPSQVISLLQKHIVL